MSLDELFKTIVLGAPNLFVALYTIFWSFRALDAERIHRELLINALLDVCVKANSLEERLEALNSRPQN